jgi:hypothetical protein
VIVSSGTGQPVVWNTTTVLGANVTVRTGTTLIIRTHVYIAPDREIEVEQGARLIIEGHLSMLADRKWSGIRLEGNQDVFHSNLMLQENVQPLASHPATCFIKPGASIEFAVSAVTFNNVVSFNDPNNLPVGFNGQLIADGACFHNNRNGINFMTTRWTDANGDNIYPPTNNRIENCFFTSDEPENKFAITSWDAFNIPVKDCDFTGFNRIAVHTIDGAFKITECNFISPAQNSAIGVSVENIGLLGMQKTDIGGSVNNTINPTNTFTGFYTGIRGLALSSGLLVHNNVFERNFMSSYCNGVGKYELFNNVFIAGPSTYGYIGLTRTSTVGGSGFSTLNNNLFGDEFETAFTGVQVAGNNNKTTLACNRFNYSTSHNDIFIWNSQPGNTVPLEHRGTLGQHGTLGRPVTNFFVPVNKSVMNI